MEQTTKTSMKSGLKPIYRNNKDFSYHLTFGSVESFAENFSVDNGTTMPDQVADQNPFECVDYAINDVSLDEDNTEKAHGYLYAKTLLMKGLPPSTQGLDIRDGFKAAATYGLAPVAAVPADLLDSGEGYNSDYTHWPINVDIAAAAYRMGQYFNVQPLNGSWFDGIRSAIQTNNKPVIIGTPWYPAWESPINGKITALSNVIPSSWHCWKIAGWKTIDGVPFLLGKTWQGEKYGDKGWAYFSQGVIDALWNIHGTQAFTISRATSEDIQTIKLDILATITTFLVRILNSLKR